MMRTRTIGLLTIFLTFAMLIAGVFVHDYDSSLLCKSWPLCYQSGDSSNLVVISVVHKLVGMIVGIFTLIFVLKITLDRESKEGLAEVGFFALFLVGLQGLMGGLSSQYELPRIVNTSHFILSLSFLSSLIYIDFKMGRQRDGNHLNNKDYQNKWYLYLSDGLGLLIFLLLLSIALGSFLRHSGALAACGIGQGLQSIECYTQGEFLLWSRLAPGQVHMLYRFLVLIVLCFGTFWSQKIFKGFNKGSKYKSRALLLGLTLFAYWLSGVLMIGLDNFKLFLGLHTALGILSFAIALRLYLPLRALEKLTLGDKSISMWRDLLDLTKPRLGSLVMSTVFVGLVLAPRGISFFGGLIGFIFTFLLVMGAAAYNCFMERDVDAFMDRTKDRPLPSGRMKPKAAFIFSVILIISSLIGLLYFTNLATALLGLIAAGLYLFAYTPLKQKSVLALYVGAIPGAIPPVMGWTMVMGKMDAMAWSLFWILFVWQLPHFLAISIYLAQDYGKAQIKVYPNSFGKELTKWGIFLLTILLAYVSLLPWLRDLGVTDRFGYFAVFLNTIFITVAFRILFIPISNDELLRRWARIYFLASIFYLPLLLGSMIYLS